MAVEKVKATQGFSGQSGTRSKDEKFDYDTAKDPQGLVRLGLVVPVTPPAPAKAKAD